MTVFSDLRARLTAECSSILEELAAGEALPPGLLCRLADVQLALQALDRCPAADTAPGGSRVLVRDVAGDALALMIFTGDTPPRGVELAPLRALALAADLTEGARRRLAEAVCPMETPSAGPSADFATGGRP